MMKKECDKITRSKRKAEIDFIFFHCAWPHLIYSTAWSLPSHGYKPDMLLIEDINIDGDFIRRYSWTTSLLLNHNLYDSTINSVKQSCINTYNIFNFISNITPGYIFLRSSIFFSNFIWNSQTLVVWKNACLVPYSIDFIFQQGNQ